MTEWIISSCGLILVVLGLRAVLKDRISQRLRYGLWALVLIRLLIPFNLFESNLSILNSAPAQVMAQVQIQAAKPITYVDYELPEIQEPVRDTNLPESKQEAVYQAAVKEYNDTIEQAKVETGRPITLTQILTAVWAAGVTITGLLLLVCNLRFGWQLKKDRQKTDIPCELPVYTTGTVSTPCLFGNAIYLPRSEAGNLALDHVLAHELGHYHQLDHVWSTLRCLCMALHWYNPLVWVASALSKKDAELSCDEATIKALGEDQRMAYGRTLIEMTCAKREAKDLLLTATTMSLGKKTLKERVQMIAKHPKTAVYTLVALILVMSLAVGCTFSSINAKDDTTVPDDSSTTPTDETTTPDDTTSPEETTVPEDTTIPQYSFPTEIQPLPSNYTLEDIVSTYQEDLYWSDDFGNEYDSTFSIPVIYPFSEDAIAIQAQINNKYMKLLEENYQHMAIKAIPRYFNIYFEASLNDGILSIVIGMDTENDYTSYDVYNIDVVTGNLLDNSALRITPESSALLTELGISESDYWAMLTAQAKKAVDAEYIGSANMNDYQDSRSSTLSSENLSSAAPYLNANGSLCVIIDIYGPAGNFPTIISLAELTP